jgi:hypothetical protein
MKDKFFGFYPPEENEIEDIWKNAIIAFDANTLLNLYRYSKNTKNDFIKTITEYSERIWLPFQVGYEFHNNRISVIKSQEITYFEISNKLDETLKKIESDFNQFKRHPFINIDKILNELSDKFEKIKVDLLKQSNKHPEYLKSDEILPSITDLFKGKVGDDYSEVELQKIFKEGEIRYNKKIPPGFSDFSSKKNETEKKLYGDLILWKQLINKSKSSKSTIIFVTDDRKEDWWLKFKGQTIRPREELIKEFYDETGFRILIYQADAFLNFAKEKLNSQVKDESIKEVKQVRLEDELKYRKEQEIIRNHISSINWLNNYSKVPELSTSTATMNIFDQIGNIPQPPKSTIDILNQIGSIPLPPKSTMDILNQFGSIPQPPKSTIDILNTIGNIPQPPKSTMDILDQIERIPQTPKTHKENIEQIEKPPKPPKTNPTSGSKNKKK